MAEGAWANGMSLRCLISIPTFMRAERKDIKFPAVGEEIQGSVEGVQNYGVFVKISDDIKAMLHGSEMASKDGREPDIRATFSIGDAIKVRSPCCMPDTAHRHLLCFLFCAAVVPVTSYAPEGLVQGALAQFVDGGCQEPAEETLRCPGPGL